MKTYRVSLYNYMTKRRVVRELQARTMLEAWQKATAYCHGTHWVCKGVIN